MSEKGTILRVQIAPIALVINGIKLQQLISSQLTTLRHHNYSPNGPTIILSQQQGPDLKSYLLQEIWVCLSFDKGAAYLSIWRIQARAKSSDCTLYLTIRMCVSTVEPVSPSGPQKVAVLER